jgi:hypothetical protein
VPLAKVTSAPESAVQPGTVPEAKIGEAKPQTVDKGTDQTRAEIKGKPGAAPLADKTEAQYNAELEKGLSLPVNISPRDREYAMSMRRLIQAGCAVAKNVDGSKAADVIHDKILPHWQTFTENMHTTFGMESVPDFTCMLGAAKGEDINSFFNPMEKSVAQSQQIQSETNHPPDKAATEQTADPAPKLGQAATKTVEAETIASPQAARAEAETLVAPKRADAAPELGSKPEIPGPTKQKNGETITPTIVTAPQTETARASTAEEATTPTVKAKPSSEGAVSRGEDDPLKQIQQTEVPQARERRDGETLDSAKSDKAPVEAPPTAVEQSVSEEEQRKTEAGGLANGLTLPDNMSDFDRRYTLEMRKLFQTGCAMANNVGGQLAADKISDLILPRWQNFNSNMHNSFGIASTPEFACTVKAARINDMNSFLDATAPVQSAQVSFK